MCLSVCSRPTSPITSKSSQRSALSPQRYVTFSDRTVPVTELSIQVSKLAIQSGKSLHPSRILPSNIDKTFKQRKSGCALSLHRGFSKTTLQQQQLNTFSRVLLNRHHKSDLNENNRIYNQLTQNNFNYKPNQTIQSPCNLPHKHSPNYTTNCNNINVSTLSNNKSTVMSHNINATVQLLHPNWRKVPWHYQFGWTQAHQRHCEWLQQQVFY